MYDIAIIGSGPAGLSAAITARMRNASCVVISPKEQGGWLHKAHQIANYPGLPQTSGRALLDTFTAQAQELGTKLHAGLVRQILKNGSMFMLLVDNEILEAKTVILAMGASRPKLLKGEEDLVGTGVSYCVTCDGMFYRGKEVALLSAGEQGVHESAFLVSLASSVTYYSLKTHGLAALDERIHVSTEKPAALKREDGKIFVNETPYDGVFIIRPAVALTQLMPGLKTEGAFISVNRLMETNMPGVYAAGDCAGQPLQIAKAVGEGNIAAITASDHLQKSISKQAE